MKTHNKQNDAYAEIRLKQVLHDAVMQQPPNLDIILKEYAQQLEELFPDRHDRAVAIEKLLQTMQEEC